MDVEHRIDKQVNRHVYTLNVHTTDEVRQCSRALYARYATMLRPCKPEWCESAKQVVHAGPIFGMPDGSIISIVPVSKDAMPRTDDPNDILNATTQEFFQYTRADGTLTLEHQFFPPYRLRENDPIYNVSLLDSTLPRITMWSSSVRVNHAHGLNVSFFCAFLPEVWRKHTHGAIWILDRDDVATEQPVAELVQKKIIMDAFRQRAMCDVAYKKVIVDHYKCASFPGVDT